MAFEKRYAAITARAFTSNGGANGTVQIADTSNFKTKQHVVITANGEPNLELEVKAVLSNTILKVGPRNSNIHTFTNISAYTTIKNAAILAAEQPRPGITNQEIIRAVYDEEPTLALRNVVVDKYGRYIDESNPLPTTATLNVENLELNVNLDAFSSTPDNSLTVGTEDGTKNGTKHVLRVGNDLNLRVKDEEAITKLTEIADALGEPLEIEKPVVVAGTRDGDPDSTPFVLVNNIKNQILQADDRVQEITYADFGTKNERIVQIKYTSPTFPSVEAIKTINYSQVGNKYRRDSIVWTIN
jgi:hypothetical protein